MKVSGSTVLITGATGGIGQAIARAVHAGGGELILTGRRDDVLERLAGELGGRALAVDLSVPAELDGLVAAAGDVDILIANAGLPASGRLDSFKAEEIDRALDVNLRAPIVLARALIPTMLEHGKGHLVFVSSLAGKAATPATSIYNATKFGLRGFAWALREELRSTGVGVSAVYPGFVSDAGMFADADVKLPPGVGTRSPEDVARAVVAAIEGDRAHVDVAPLAMRASTVFAGVAPQIAGRLARRLGSERLVHDLAAGQTDKR